MDSNWHLAQLNIAKMLAPTNSPELAEFMENLDRINELADSAPGFVWRLQSEEGDATEFRHFGDDYLVNMSVWTDVESLSEYVYRTAHADIMRKRRQWFDRMREAFSVLWWVPAGHRPDLAEAERHLQILRERGAGPEAFTFAQAYPPPAS